MENIWRPPPPPPPQLPLPPPPLPIQSALKIWVFCHDIVSKGVLITVSNFQSPYWKLIDFHIQVTTEIGNNEKYWDGPNLNTCVHCTVTVYSISQSSDLLYKMPKCYGTVLLFLHSFFDSCLFHVRATFLWWLTKFIDSSSSMSSRRHSSQERCGWNLMGSHSSGQFIHVHSIIYISVCTCIAWVCW